MLMKVWRTEGIIFNRNDYSVEFFGKKWKKGSYFLIELKNACPPPR